MQTPTGTPAPRARSGRTRSRWAGAARRLRAGLACAAVAAVAAGLLPAGVALAATSTPADQATARAVTLAGDGGAPAPSGADTNARRHAAVPGPGPMVSRGVRAACGAPRPGYARCFALLRTNVKMHGPSAAGGFTPVGYSPADLRSAYHLPSGSAGAGQTVAVVDAYDDPSAARDLATYRAQYGLPPCTTASGCFRKVAQDGGTDYPVPDEGWGAEISLDLDMVSAICPRCHILLVEANSASFDDLGASVNEAVTLGAKYVSNSYGEYEPAHDITAALQARYDQLYYNQPGVAVTAASGDSGYGVSYPASSTDVVAVGGTSLTRDTSTARGWTETAWSGTGSGCSASEPKPAWQHDTGCTNRTVADVSAVADPNTGVAVYDSYTTPGFVAPGWSLAGGTSVASPIIASVYALAGTPTAAANPASYPYADPSALNDITSGGNGTCTPAYLCTAGPGFDGPTGLGTPDGVAAFEYGVHGSHGDLAGTVTDKAGHPVAGARVSAGGFAALTDAAGRYDLAAAPGTVSVTASAFAYADKTVPQVTVTAGQTQRENFALSSVPMEKVSGTIRDGSGHDWPLYAKVSVPGTPAVTYTNPTTGRYRLRLPANASYTVQADPVYAGYQQVSRQVTVGTTAVRQNLAALIDTAACAAPGYHPVAKLSEKFRSTTVPAGWSVINNGQDPQSTWQFDKPGGWPNHVGAGNYAVAFTHDTSVPDDEELITPVMNLSGDRNPRLQFTTYDQLSAGGFPHMSVDVSVDGGKTWSVAELLTPTDTFGVALHASIALAMAADQPSVQLRFHYTLPAIDLQILNVGWQLDDVSLANCVPSRGGLVTGRVLDANTRQGVDGATISVGKPGGRTSSMAVPGATRNAHGFYAVFAAPGSQRVTAAAPGYATGSETATVTANKVTGAADLALKAGRVSVPGGPVTATAVVGGAAAATVTVHNSGSAPAMVNFDPRPGGFAPAGPPAARGTAAAGYPVRVIHGRFSPRPGVPPVLAGQGRHAAVAAGSLNDSPWVRLAQIPAALGGAAGAVDPVTGKVYAVGGETALGQTAAVSVFDPSTGRWSGLPRMSTARAFASAVSIGGKLYVAGGEVPGGAAGPLDIYDPALGSWTQGAPMPHPYTGMSAVVLNGKMYLIGGCNPTFCGESDVQVYDPATDRWSAAADYPVPVSRANCGAIAGKIYCAGGVGNLYTSQTRAGYAYDPATNTWTPIADMPVSLWGGSSGAANGKLLVSGGVISQGNAFTNRGYAYDPASNTWSALPNAPQPAYEGASACGFYGFGGWSFFNRFTGPVNPTPATWQLPGYGGCGGQGWLTARPATTTVAPGQTATIKVTLNAADPSVTQPGTYTASFRVGNSTPYGAPTVPVTFTVKPPKTWGHLAGTVTGTTCAGTSTALPGATVQVSAGSSTWLLTADAAANYAEWLPAASKVRLITTLAGWQPQAATVNVPAGTTTTHNVTLKQVCA